MFQNEEVFKNFVVILAGFHLIDLKKRNQLQTHLWFNKKKSLVV